MKTNKTSILIIFILGILLSASSAIAANPIIGSIANQRAVESVEFSLIVTATDADNDTLAINGSSSTLPGWLTVDSTNKMLLKGRPRTADIGTTEVSLYVTDGVNDSAEKKFNLTIVPALQISSLVVNSNAAEDGDNVNVTPGQQITVDLDFTNNFDKDLSHIATTAAVSASTPVNPAITGLPHSGVCEGANCDSDSDGYWILRQGLSGDDSFTFTVPAAITESSFKVEIKVTYDNFWDFLPWVDTLTDQVDLTFNVAREEAATLITTDPTLADDQLTCTRITNMDLEITNTGERTMTPEILIYDKSPILSSFNPENGKFTQFTGVPKIKIAKTLSPINPSANRVLSVDNLELNLSALAEGKQTLYIYVINPYATGVQKYVADSAIVELSVGSCLNTEAIEDHFTLAKNGAAPADLNLFETDADGYVYINEDLNYESSLSFSIALDNDGKELQSNPKLIDCAISGSIVSCGTPAVDEEGVSRVSIKVKEGKSEIIERFDVTVEADMEFTAVTAEGLDMNDLKTNNPTLKPLENLDISFTLQNFLNQPINNVIVEIDDDDENDGYSFDFSDQQKSFHLSSKGRKTETISVKIPADVPAGDYDLILTAIGRPVVDNGKKRFTDSFAFTITVNPEDTEIILNAELAAKQQNTIVCDPAVELHLKATNTGLASENDVVLQVKEAGKVVWDSNPKMIDADFISINSNGEVWDSIVAGEEITLPLQGLGAHNYVVIASYNFDRNGVPANAVQVSVPTITKTAGCLDNAKHKPFDPDGTGWIVAAGVIFPSVDSVGSDGFTAPLKEEAADYQSDQASNVNWYILNKDNKMIDTDGKVINGPVQTGGSRYDQFSSDVSGDYRVVAKYNNDEQDKITWRIYVTDIPISSSGQIRSNIQPGTTTDKLMAFNDLYVESTQGYGSIQFHGTSDLVGLLDFDDSIIFGQGYVSVDGSDEWFLDNATITLKNIPQGETFIYKYPKFGKLGTDDLGVKALCDAAAGCVFGSAAHSNNVFTFDISKGFSTFQVVTKQDTGLSIMPTELLLENVALGADIEKTLTIKNEGNLESITNLAFTSTIPAKYNAVLNETPSSLNPKEQKNIKLNFKIPLNEEAGKHKIGEIKVNGKINNQNMPQKVIPVYVKTQSFLKVGINAEDLEMEETSEVKIDITNEYSEDIEDLEVTLELIDEDDEAIYELSEDIDKIRKGDKEDLTFELDLSDENLNQNKYVLRVTVSGEAVDDNSNHETVEETEVKLTLEKHNLVISKVEMGSESLTCQAYTDLQVIIANLGQEDEEDIVVTVKNSALEINQDKDNLDLERFVGDDNEEKLSFTLNINDAKAGTYPLDIEVFRDEDKSEDTEKVDLVIKECVTAQSSSQTQVQLGNADVLAKQLQEQLAQRAAAQASARQTTQQTESQVSASFRDSQIYLIMLGLLLLMIFIALVLGLAVLALRSRRH